MKMFHCNESVGRRDFSLSLFYPRGN